MIRLKRSIVCVRYRAPCPAYADARWSSLLHGQERGGVMGILHQILPPQIHLLDVLNHAVLLRRLLRNARRRGYLSGRHGKLPQH